MLMLGQLQLQEDQTAEGLATLDKYFAESKSTKPEELIAKGRRCTSWSATRKRSRC